MRTTIIRRSWRCLFCDYHQEGVMSYYKWRKMYSAHYDTNQKHIDALAKYKANLTKEGK